MAPLHANVDLRAQPGQYREERCYTRVSSRVHKTSSDGSKRTATPRRTDSFRRQERHFMQRSDAYLTSRELSAPRVNFRAKPTQRSEFRRNVDYRKSLVIEKKVEGIYGYIKKPAIPAVDYLSSKEIGALNKRVTKATDKFGLFSPSSSKLLRDPLHDHPTLKPAKSFSNLTRLKSAVKFEIHTEPKNNPSNLKSALKLSKSDSRLNSKLEVRWDSGSEDKTNSCSDWHSESSGSKTDANSYAYFNGKKSPPVNRKGNKSITKSLAKNPLFVCKRSSVHYSSARVMTYSKKSSKYLIPRAKVKTSTSGALATYKVILIYISIYLTIFFLCFME